MILNECWDAAGEREVLTMSRMNGEVPREKRDFACCSRDCDPFQRYNGIYLFA